MLTATESEELRTRLEAELGRLVANAAVVEPDPTPEPRVGPPVAHTATLPVLSVITTPSGRTVLDFGQNMVSHVRFTASGERGERVTLRHAEVLEHGELGTQPLRRAIQTDQYVLAGGAPETWEPEFTFHGFRYVEVDGWPGELDPTAFEAVVVHSDMARTGGFECSDDLLNRLHENAVWGMRGNFLSIPSDCPQRDERWGWTGDIQVFGPTASFLFDTDGFPEKYLFNGLVKGQVLSPRSVQLMMSEAKKKAGIQKKGSIHTLRNCYATHHLENGTDLVLTRADGS